jgi:hypothetical protein
MDNLPFHLSKFNRYQIFFVIIIFIVIFAILTYFFKFENTTTGFIILFVFAFYVATFYLNYNTNILSDDNKLLMYKLNFIQNLVYDHVTYKLTLLRSQNFAGLNQADILKNLDFEKMLKDSYLDALYIDSDLIEFIYLNRNLYDKNQEAFVNFVLSTNTFLRVLKELQDDSHPLPNNTQQLIQVALEKYSNALENLKSFIFTIESGSVAMKQLNDVQNNYMELMYYNVLQLENYNKLFLKEYGINNQTVMNIFPITSVAPINAKYPNKNLQLSFE